MSIDSLAIADDKDMIECAVKVVAAKKKIEDLQKEFDENIVKLESFPSLVGMFSCFPTNSNGKEVAFKVAEVVAGVAALALKDNGLTSQKATKQEPTVKKENKPKKFLTCDAVLETIRERFRTKFFTMPELVCELKKDYNACYSSAAYYVGSLSSRGIVVRTSERKVREDTAGVKPYVWRYLF